MKHYAEYGPFHSLLTKENPKAAQTTSKRIMLRLRNFSRDQLTIIRTIRFTTHSSFAWSGTHGRSVPRTGTAVCIDQETGQSGEWHGKVAPNLPENRNRYAEKQVPSGPVGTKWRAFTTTQRHNITEETRKEQTNLTALSSSAEYCLFLSFLKVSSCIAASYRFPMGICQTVCAHIPHREGK